MKSFVLIFTVLFSSAAQSCMEPKLPDLENLQKYSEIFIGEVTGVVLDQYQAARKHDISRSKMVPSPNQLNLGHQIHVVVVNQLKGSSSPTIHKKILGCGSWEPALRMHGIFFIEKDSGNIIPIYEHQGVTYFETILAVSKSNH